MSKSNKGKKYNSSGRQHEHSSSWMNGVAYELARMKKATLSPTSRYFKKRTNYDHTSEKCGIAYSILHEMEKIGSQDEWLRGYKYFCKQKVNTKGQKVNRTHLSEFNYNKSKYIEG